MTNRLVILGLTLLTLAATTALGTPGMAALPWCAGAAFVAAYALGRTAPRAANWVVLPAASLAPAIATWLTDSRNPALPVVWLAAWAGVAIARSSWTRWQLGEKWSAPLSLWALTIAVTWPIVGFREVDFIPDLIVGTHGSVSHLGLPPRLEVLFIALSASKLLVAIVWLDAIGGAPRTSDEDFRTHTLWPMALGVTIASGVAVYQMLGDINFLNTGLYAYLGRASGTLMDANALGAAAAVTAPVLMWLAIRWRANAARSLAAGVSGAVVAAGTWGSGSRTALAGLLISGALIAAPIVLRRKRARPIIWTAAAVAVVAVVAVVTAGALRIGSSNPAARMRDMIEGHSWRSVVEELWNRNQYGYAAATLVRRFPWTGIGVGTFHAIGTDEIERLGRGSVGPDNAQNWYRHMLVEFGVLGSIGWMAFAVMLAALLWRRASTPDGAAAKAPIVAIGLVSLVGMPSQQSAVLLIFVTFVAWLIQSERAAAEAAPAPIRALKAPVIWVLVIVCAIVTAYVGVTRLRVPLRAVSARWEYAHGVYPLEQAPSGQKFMRTDRRSTQVVRLPTTQEHQPLGNVLRLTLWIDDPEVTSRPVRLRLRRKGREVLDVTIGDHEPRTYYLATPAGDRMFMLDTEVDRAFRLPGDARALGVTMGEWRWVVNPLSDGVFIQ